MIGGLQGTLVAAGLTGIVALGLGWKMGADGEARNCDRKIQAVRTAAETVINQKLQEILTLQAETAQAKAEVEKVNATTARQFAELQTLLSADQIKREEAAARVEKIAAQAAAEAKRAGERALAAKQVIDNAPDQCTRAGVPDDVRRVLNDVLGATP